MSCGLSSGGRVAGCLTPAPAQRAQGEDDGDDDGDTEPDQDGPPRDDDESQAEPVRDVGPGPEPVVPSDDHGEPSGDLG